MEGVIMRNGVLRYRDTPLVDINAPFYQSRDKTGDVRLPSFTIRGVGMCSYILPLNSIEYLTFIAWKRSCYKTHGIYKTSETISLIARERVFTSFLRDTKFSDHHAKLSKLLEKIKLSYSFDYVVSDIPFICESLNAIDVSNATVKGIVNLPNTNLNTVPLASVPSSMVGKITTESLSENLEHLRGKKVLTISGINKSLGSILENLFGFGESLSTTLFLINRNNN